MSKTHKKCCIPTCNNKTLQESFHEFPSKVELKEKWLNNISLLLNLTKIRQYSTVCNLHFDENCYDTTRTGKRRLREGAVPTIFKILKSDGNKEEKGLLESKEEKESNKDDSSIPTFEEPEANLIEDKDSPQVKKEQDEFFPVPEAVFIKQEPENPLELRQEEEEEEAIPEKRFKCLRSHERSHANLDRPRERVECDVCEKSYTHANTLWAHKKLAHGNGAGRRFGCDVCGKSYLYGSTLRVHKRTTHEGLRESFGCDVCGKSYSSVRNLREHKLRHAEGGNKRFGCDVCGNAYASLYYLRLHKQMHESAEETRFECDVCGKSYSHGMSLRAHMYTHEKGVTRKRDACPEQFSDSQPLGNDCRNSFKEELTTVTSLDMEMVKIKTEIKQEW